MVNVEAWRNEISKKIDFRLKFQGTIDVTKLSYFLNALGFRDLHFFFSRDLVFSLLIKWRTFRRRFARTKPRCLSNVLARSIRSNRENF